MSSCLPPYAEGVNPTFERLGQDRMTCKAKGCCWDNDINKGKKHLYDFQLKITARCTYVTNSCKPIVSLENST